MADKRKDIKIPYVGKKKKLGINQQNGFQTTGRGRLQNLTKVCITTKGNGSMKNNMEKDGITMNIAMMTLIWLQLTTALVVVNWKLSHIITLYRMKCFCK